MAAARACLAQLQDPLEFNPANLLKYFQPVIERDV
jgi:hypothetical protein